MTDASAGRTGIEFTGKASILLIWFFFLFKPQIDVDGSTYAGAWNSPTLIAAAPGQHKISAYYKMYWVLPVNRVDLTVTVPEGGMARVQYKPSAWGMLGKGKLTKA